MSLYNVLFALSHYIARLVRQSEALLLESIHDLWIVTFFWVLTGLYQISQEGVAKDYLSDHIQPVHYKLHLLLSSVDLWA